MDVMGRRQAMDSCQLDCLELPCNLKFGELNSMAWDLSASLVIFLKWDQTLLIKMYFITKKGQTKKYFP